jgi:VIT1/CCC1 family predicted Fe2+/Mn2+ transporter
MSERTSEEGNTDAPQVEEKEIRSGDGRAESGTRRVGDARREHEEDRRRRENELGTSWISVVFGWLAALGAGLILSGIVGAVVGGILGVLGVQGGTEGGIAGLVGLLLTLLLAFLIGGYVAGRLASRSGFKHGILVPVLSLLVILVLAIVGSILGASFIDQLSGIALPQVPGNVQNQIPQQGLGTILTASGVVALLVPFIGGALGGLWGAKTGRNRP